MPIGFGLVVAGLVALAIWQFLNPAQAPATQVAYSEFLAQVRADKEKEPHVERATVKDREITFLVKDPKTQSTAKKVTVMSILAS